MVLWDKKYSMVQMLSTASPRGPPGLFNYSVPGLAAIHSLMLPCCGKGRQKLDLVPWPLKTSRLVFQGYK